MVSTVLKCHVVPRVIESIGDDGYRKISESIDFPELNNIIRRVLEQIRKEPSSLSVEIADIFFKDDFLTNTISHISYHVRLQIEEEANFVQQFQQITSFYADFFKKVNEIFNIWLVNARWQFRLVFVMPTLAERRKSILTGYPIRRPILQLKSKETRTGLDTHTDKWFQGFITEIINPVLRSFNNQVLEFLNIPVSVQGILLYEYPNNLFVNLHPVLTHLWDNINAPKKEYPSEQPKDPLVEIGDNGVIKIKKKPTMPSILRRETSSREKLTGKEEDQRHAIEASFLELRSPVVSHMWRDCQPEPLSGSFNSTACTEQLVDRDHGASPEVVSPWSEERELPLAGAQLMSPIDADDTLATPATPRNNGFFRSISKTEPNSPERATVRRRRVSVA